MLWRLVSKILVEVLTSLIVEGVLAILAAFTNPRQSRYTRLAYAARRDHLLS
jgi:hypothetical protein